MVNGTQSDKLGSFCFLQPSKKDLILEALRQNWETARYYESARWKYSYYYYGAFVGVLLVALKIENGADIFSAGDSRYVLFLFLLSLFLALAGFISFGNLLHANIEYKNHIRAIEWIARDIGLNKGITEHRKIIEHRKKKRVTELLARLWFQLLRWISQKARSLKWDRMQRLIDKWLSQYRKKNTNIERYTYMALPLMHSPRAGICSFKFFTTLITALSSGAFFFFWSLYFSFYSGASPTELYTWVRNGIIVLIIAICFCFSIFLLLGSKWDRAIDRADKELDERDPLIYRESKGSII